MTNSFFSRSILFKRKKNDAFVTNPDEYYDGSTHQVAIYVINSKVRYFDFVKYFDILINIFQKRLKCFQVTKRLL